MSAVVSVYMTTDGAYFREKLPAELHQQKVDLWYKAYEKFGCYSKIEISNFTEFLELMNFIEENK